MSGQPGWRKSSRSAAYNGCVEAAVIWRPSGRCQTGECVEAAPLPVGPWPPNVAAAVARKLAQPGRSGDGEGGR